MSNPFAARFAASPALVSPEKQGVFEACLHAIGKALADRPELASAEVMGDDFWPEEGSWRAAYRPYIVVNSVLQIPIKGVLLHDFPWQMGGWATGYDYIWKAFERGMGDYNVKGIALVIDSPGGEVAGNFDLVDKMFAMRGTKPIRAYASESAYSAAYSIASVADSITVTRTGGVGSIGVVTSHVDYSKAMEDAGVKVTFIYAGEHKVDGNPYQALPDSVKERMQSRIDTLYAVFVSTVARNRSMEEQAVRDTEALTYSAEDAISIGLADAVGSFADAVAAFCEELASCQGDENMSDTPNEAALESAKAAGIAEGAKAERARVKAIVESDAAKTRAAAAFNIALNTNLSVDEATALLATLPEDKKESAQAESAPTSATSPFEAAMAQGNPELGAGGGASGSQADADPVAEILAAARTFGVIAKK